MKREPIDLTDKFTGTVKVDCVLGNVMISVDVSTDKAARSMSIERAYFPKDTAPPTVHDGDRLRIKIERDSVYGFVVTESHPFKCADAQVRKLEVA